MIWLGLILAFLLGLLHFFSEEFYLKYFQEHHKALMSFAAGVSVTYLLTHLIPDILLESLKFEILQSKLIFSYLLAGFVVFHLVEKYVQQHVKSKMLLKDLRWIHFVSLFVYHAVIGIMIIHYAEEGFKYAFFFAVPVALNLVVLNISFHNVHKEDSRPKGNYIFNIIGSLAVLAGAIFALKYKLPLSIVLSGAAFVAGSLMFIVIRETVPKEKEGSGWIFLLGILVYWLLVYVSGLIY